MSQSRTYSWIDAAAAASELPNSSGLEFCRAAVERGWQLPIWSTLDMRMTRVDAGLAVLELVPQPFLANPGGIVHGGVISTALDSAASAAVHTVLGPGEIYSTIDLNVHFTRPAKIDGRPITATGRVVNEGRQLVLAEARMTDSAERLLAHAVATLRVVRA